MAAPGVLIVTIGRPNDAMKARRPTDGMPGAATPGRAAMANLVRRTGRAGLQKIGNGALPGHRATHRELGRAGPDLPAGRPGTVTPGEPVLPEIGHVRPETGARRTGPIMVVRPHTARTAIADTGIAAMMTTVTAMRLIFGLTYRTALPPSSLTRMRKQNCALCQPTWPARSRGCS